MNGPFKRCDCDEQIQNVNRKLSKQESQLRAHLKRMDENDSLVSGAEDKITAMRPKLTALERSLKELSKKVGQLEKTLTAATQLLKNPGPEFEAKVAEIFERQFQLAERALRSRSSKPAAPTKPTKPTKPAKPTPTKRTKRSKKR